ncbi:arginine N-succinyltransferase [Paraglaciecola hydrolytica]|uniref:Arginine N-succinyltransferase n=1 Tax=Paraglaciecola hydrolytica TaxID=1799789 RepID=A0A148KN06_9ALTE|nr:arginine N-succinyltransferase [Paraglaciecola hydrolytica]KXI27692.1 arginine N-succinyltransferase [Paraglaciecola hydrolytica]
MQIIRPIRQSDFAALKQISIEAGHGFTSLPQCDDQLTAKIQHAETAVSDALQANKDGSYLFVLEDSETQTILGTTGIEACVGHDSPLYHYRISQNRIGSKLLGVNRTVNTLSVCNDYHGASEICTLFLRKAYRNGSAGRLLSKIRFLFMAQHPERFSSTVIAEMRGVSDEHGQSPFWQWLQEHFFDIDFATAVHLVGTGEKHFIAELMPAYPIYLSLLSKEAQAVVSQPHNSTVPALRLLQQEGFQHKGYVDLFDAGPTVEAQLHDIASVKNSTLTKVKVTAVQGKESIMLCNTSVEHFRGAISDQVKFDENSQTLFVSPDVANQLLLGSQDEVRFMVM